MYRQVYQKTNSWFGTACFQCESLRYFVGKAAIKMAEQKSEIDIVGRFAGIEQAHTLQSKKEPLFDERSLPMAHKHALCRW